MILGGGHLVSFDGTLGLGVNPSACNGQVRMDTTAGPQAFTLGVGDYIVFSFHGLGSFYGVITQTGSSSKDPSSGTVHSFTMLDNRIRLQWQEVYGVWNMEDEMIAKRLSRPTAPSAPGDVSGHGSENVGIGASVEGASGVEGAPGLSAPVDSGVTRRRFWSILPQHWASRIRTWHDRPFNAREIFNFAFAGAWGDFGFSRVYHPALSSLELYGLDYSTGVKLSNLISTINDKAGLDIHIVGSRQLVWVRKGEGLLPLPDETSTDIESGQSLSASGTAVRVVGERVRVQVVNVELEPDWKSGWEAFIDELAWRREVATVFELSTDTKADQANLSAKAREVTVYQYAKQKNDPSFLDYRMFDRLARNQMSAWDYIQNLVFRSYRIPPARTLYGIPISSLEMADTLLVGTDINGEGEEAVQDYVSNPVEFYPPVQAQVIHKGQPLDFLRARDIRLFYLNGRDLRDEWTVATDYEVDPLNMSIRFSAPVFIDGLASENKSLYLRMNRGEGGGNDLTEMVGEESDYLDVVVPNPNAEIAPAAVRGSFCFMLGNYHRDYGSGPRRETLSVPGLGLHLLDTRGTGSFSVPGVDDFADSDLSVPDTSGASFKEVLFEDGGKARQKADAAASSFIGQSAIQASGGFTRHGVVATSPSGVVDRVSVRVSMAGVAEVVSFTKAPATGAPLAERTLQRIQRTQEAYRGQEESRKEIRELRLIAAAEKTSRQPERSGTHRRFEDVFSKPVGSEVQNTVILYDKNSVAPTRGGVKKWQAGDIVWVDGAGVPVASGGAFAGVLVATPKMVASGEGEVQSKELCVANKGIVPVRIRGAVSAGASLRANKGEHFAGETGDTPIGMLMHGEDLPVPEGEDPEVLAMVNLGFGGGAGDSGPCWFGEIVTWDADSGSGTDMKTGVRGGIIEAGEDQWWVENHEISSTPDRDKLLWIELEILANATEDGSVTLSGIKAGNKAGMVWNEGDVSAGYPDKIIPPIFPPEGVTPGAGKIILPIGRITVAGGAISLEAAGCGHFVVTHCPGVLSYTRRGGGIDSQTL